MPDSALLLRAYKKWGDDCADHLLGDFAFAIWDGRARKLVLGRDHMGQRYVHYHQREDFFVFATDIEGPCGPMPMCRSVLSDREIGQMLVARPLAARGATPFEGIHGLAGARRSMTIGADGSLAQRRYWEPHADPAHEGRDEAYYIEAYRRVLGEAVACRVRRTFTPPGLCSAAATTARPLPGLPARCWPRAQARSRPPR